LAVSSPKVSLQKGHFVYAGARKASDPQALNAIENVQALRLDVTDSQHIAAAVKAVEKGGRGLHGLVNSAGRDARSRRR